MKRYLFLATGTGIFIWGVIMSIWSAEELPYLISSFTARIRILSAVVTLVSGVIFFYYGSKKERINWATDISLIVLFVTFVIYVLESFFGCHRFGTPCTQSEWLIGVIAGSAIPIGICLSFLTLVASLFLKRKTQNSLSFTIQNKL